MGSALEYELPKGNEAPGLARDLMRGLAHDVRPELIEDATLLVSELVTNGVRYGGEGQIKLKVQTEPGRLRAEVADQGGGFEPQTRASSRMMLHDAGGWGLHLVETLADEWGMHEGRTHVWFEIRRG